MTSTNLERLRTQYKKYKLSEDDLHFLEFGKTKIPIIKRTGIDKIQAIENIKINYDCIEYTPGISAATKATATLNDLMIESFGEANTKNNKNAYPLAMAEKRAMSRVILKLTGFYELGVYGEDEIEEPKNPTKPWKNI